MGEDRSRIRITPSVFAKLRRFAFNIFESNCRSPLAQDRFRTSIDGPDHLHISERWTAMRRRGPWRNLEAVESATLEWVDRFNHHRLVQLIGKIPPAKAEARYYAAQRELALAARLKLANLRQNRGGSHADCQPDLVEPMTSLLLNEELAEGREVFRQSNHGGGAGRRLFRGGRFA